MVSEMVLMVIGVIAGTLALGFLINRVQTKAMAQAEDRREAALDAVRSLTLKRRWRMLMGHDSNDTLDWTVTGETAAGRRFTVEHHFHTSPSGDGNNSNVDVMRWCCPGLKCSPGAFHLWQRSLVSEARSGLGDFLVAGATVMAGIARAAGATDDTSAAEDEVDLMRNGQLVPAINSSLGPRWGLAARDIALAQKVFDAALCETIRNLPRSRKGGADTDWRCEIGLGPRGLVVDLGFRTPGAGEVTEPGMLQRVTALGERLEAALTATGKA